MAPRKSPRKKRDGRKNKTFLRDHRPTYEEFKAQQTQLLPALREIRDKATKAGNGDPEKTKAEVWKLLPAGVEKLNSMATAATWYRVEIVRTTALQKLACLLTRPNRWGWSWDVWDYSQALQQLFPVWRISQTKTKGNTKSNSEKEKKTFTTGFLREFRFSFSPDLSPEEISTKMSHLRDNVFEELDWRMTYVIAKHLKKGKKSEKSAFTEWHVHGFAWPLAGPAFPPARFAREYARLRETVENRKKGYGLSETYWRVIKDFPRAAAYLASNFYRAKCYRKMLREKHKPAHEPLPPDAAENVKLFAVPNHLWLAPGKKAVKQKPGDKKCDKAMKRKDNPNFVHWRTQRGTGRVTAFSTAYRRAAEDVATSREREEEKMDVYGRRETFRRACQTVEDIPHVPSVVGFDGFVYQVIVGNAQWFETPFFLLWRDEVAEDYTLLKLPVPKQLGEVAVPISLYDLHKLGQAELTVHVPRATFRPVCPVTGKPPKPLCDKENIIWHVGRAIGIDAALEAQWLRRAKKAAPTSWGRPVA